MDTTTSCFRSTTKVASATRPWSPIRIGPVSRENMPDRRVRDDIFVCSSRRFHRPAPYQATSFQDWDNPEVRVPLVNPAFNFSDISQNNGTSGQQHYDNMLWYRSKVREHGVRPINHVKCYHFNWPIGANFNRDRTAPSDAEAGAKFWRAVFAGAASIRFHRHTPTRPGGLREGFGLAPEGQRHLQSMREFVAAVHLFAMEPHNDLLLDRDGQRGLLPGRAGTTIRCLFHRRRRPQRANSTAQVRAPSRVALA